MATIITRGAMSAKALGFTGQTTTSVYIEDVFSTYLYTGNGSTQTITNGIGLSTNGGLVWLKGRSGATDHALYDTTRGATFDLTSTSTAAQTTQSTGLTAFGTTGFTIGALAKLNTSASTYASWTFRKQPKFFDVVTYTGTGSARTIAHSLGATPGMIIVKRTDTTGNWQVYHNGLTSAANSIQLNLTAAQASATTVWNSTAPTSSVFSVGTDATVNASGGTYVAYLFAASNSGGFGAAGTDSVVACGSYTGGSSPTITLGWEPQFIIFKEATGTNAASSNWIIQDTMRGFIVDATGASFLQANTSAVESAGNQGLSITSTGFKVNAGSTVNDPSGTYIYLAIRRGPMKVPTSGTSVFAPIASAAAVGTALTTGFPIDSQWKNARAGGVSINTAVDDRLRGVSTTSTASGAYLTTSATNTEATTNGTTQAFSNIGFQVTTYYGGVSTIYWNFGRAPGFFDVVCYTGTGTSPNTKSHNLTVAPELIIWKCRSAVTSWPVWCKYTGSSSNDRNAVFLNTTAASTDEGFQLINVTLPTSSQFSMWNNAYNNAVGSTYAAYLFATCPGVSKVGSYTGTGAAQNINCGFSAGARFVLIKRTDSTGDWYTYDSARGISSGNDPYLLLNSTAAEVTGTNYVDTFASGFTLTATAPAGLNANGGSYIFLAIA